MLEKIKKYPNFYQQIEANFCNKDNFFHAYIIEVNDNENYEEIIDELVKYIFSRKYSEDSLEYKRIFNLINENNFSDYKKIVPDGNIIKKEQLLFVKESFKTKSFNNNQVYAIFEADKMNHHASNTILKFLEEPNEGVIAFLVVKNRYMLLDTIISRCQILTLDNLYEADFESDDLVHFFEFFSSKQNAFLNFDKILKELFVDKKETMRILDLLEKKYYNYICDGDFENNLDLSDNSSNLSVDKTLDLIEIINEEKSKLLYNVNFKLWLDNFIIKFMEVQENV